jgi:hypothetical protein
MLLLSGNFLIFSEGEAKEDMFFRPKYRQLFLRGKYHYFRRGGKRGYVLQTKISTVVLEGKWAWYHFRRGEGFSSDRNIDNFT